LNEDGVKQKKPRFGQAISTHAVWITFPNHIFDTLKLLQLQWCIEALPL